MPELFWWMGGALIATILLGTTYLCIRESWQENLARYKAVVREAKMAEEYLRRLAKDTDSPSVDKIALLLMMTTISQSAIAYADDLKRGPNSTGGARCMI